jgi:hypothetical protein
MSARATGGTSASKSVSVEMLPHLGVVRRPSSPFESPPQEDAGSGKGSTVQSGVRQEEALGGRTKDPVAARWRERRNETHCVASAQREASSGGSGDARKGHSAADSYSRMMWGRRGPGGWGWQRGAAARGSGQQRRCRNGEGGRLRTPRVEIRWRLLPVVALDMDSRWKEMPIMWGPSAKRGRGRQVGPAATNSSI